MNSTSMRMQPISYHRAHSLCKDDFVYNPLYANITIPDDGAKPSACPVNLNCSNSVSTVETAPGEHSAFHKHADSLVTAQVHDSGKSDFEDPIPIAIVVDVFDPSEDTQEELQPSCEIASSDPTDLSHDSSYHRPEDNLGGSRDLSPGAMAHCGGDSDNLHSVCGASLGRPDDFLGGIPSSYSYHPRHSARRAGNSWI